MPLLRPRRPDDVEQDAFWVLWSFSDLLCSSVIVASSHFDYVELVKFELIDSLFPKLVDNLSFCLSEDINLPVNSWAMA